MTSFLLDFSFLLLIWSVVVSADVSMCCQILSRNSTNVWSDGLDDFPNKHFQAAFSTNSGMWCLQASHRSFLSMYSASKMVQAPLWTPVLVPVVSNTIAQMFSSTFQSSHTFAASWASDRPMRIPVSSLGKTLAAWRNFPSMWSGEPDIEIMNLSVFPPPLQLSLICFPSQCSAALFGGTKSRLICSASSFLTLLATLWDVDVEQTELSRILFLSIPEFSFLILKHYSNEYIVMQLYYIKYVKNFLEHGI